MHATFALISDSMELYTLTKQMGTSMAMIETPLPPSHAPVEDMLTGDRHQLADGDLGRVAEFQTRL